MPDNSESFSDFLDDSDHAFDIESLASEFEENFSSPPANDEPSEEHSDQDDEEASKSEDSLEIKATGFWADDLSDTASEEYQPPTEDAFALELASQGSPKSTPSDAPRVFEDDFEVDPLSILEGMLFVGNEDNTPITAESMSSLMRGVSVEEIDDLVAELNVSYRSNRSPFEVIFEADGYRLVLAKGFEFCRRRFYREEKAATLSQSVIDVLALVAYLQPVSRKQIEEKRLKPSGSILNQLVRRKLVEVTREKKENKTEIFYRTTDRFLDLFELDSLEELPKSQVFESPN